MASRSERLAHSLLLSAARDFRPASWQPPADVYQVADGWLVKFELAGVRPDEVQVLIEGNRLVLSGRRRDVSIEQGQRSYSMEISYSEFQRAIGFPCELANMELATDYRDGMLLVRLTCRDAREEPRR